MGVTAGPFSPGLLCRATWGFSIGRYGWTESFVRPFGDGGFRGMETASIAIAKLRMAMCGSGVFMDTIRLSDIAVRRDADDNAVDYLARSGGDNSTPSFDFTIVKTAEDSLAYNPNVCIVLRIEGDDKVYHGQHSLGGMPASKFTSGERLQDRPAWSTAYTTWQNKLISDGWGFLALNRTGAEFADVRVTKIEPVIGKITVAGVPGGWVKGDRIRIINAVVPNKRRGGSILVEFDSAALNVITVSDAFGIPNGAKAGPATIAHKESTAFVTLRNTEPEYASHRNRGRPLFSPRGRRARR